MKKIKSIEIKDATFFEDIKVEFSSNLNCIMGGRGTGKTTLLYFIKSAIDANIEGSGLTDKILKSNLGNGSITLEIEGENATTYTITKTLNELPQPYILPSQEFISIDKIQTEIECDIYEAGRIEEIGRSSLDRLELLDKKIGAELIEYSKILKEAQIDLSENASDIQSINKRSNQILEIISQYETVDEEFETHKKHQPSGIKEEEKQEFESADIKEKIRRDEKRYLSKTISAYSEFKAQLGIISNDLQEQINQAENNKDNFYNNELLKPGYETVESTISKIQTHIEQINTEINSSSSLLNQVFSNLSDKHDIQQAEFIKLKQKFEENKEYINKYHSLSKKVDEKKEIQNTKADLDKKYNKLIEKRAALVKKLNDAKQAIFNSRLAVVKELNAEFNNHIIITLIFNGITDEFQEKLRDALRGSGMRYNELIPKIVNNFSTDQFAHIIREKDIDSLKSIAMIDDIRSEALINALFDTDAIFEIEGLYCPDLPEFKLKITNDSAAKENDYRKTDDLSMGQRCTAVLPIIFAVSTNPLIIDQPEDNLDNKYIAENIHEIITTQKLKRQLIFITHNPNIPVLSEAEKNIFLLYENGSSNIDGHGTVDEVKDQIVNLLEGGAEAFKRRRTIYGFQN